MSHGNYVIPKTMKAAVVRATGASLEVVDNWPVPQPDDLAPGEVLLKMECTGVCHTDLHAAKGDWPIPAKTPLIGGHEVRTIFAVNSVFPDIFARRVLVSSLPSAPTLRTRPSSSATALVLSGSPTPASTASTAATVLSRVRIFASFYFKFIVLCRNFSVCAKGEYSGFTVDGTFSEYVKSYIRHVSPIPEGLSSADAASILCAVSWSVWLDASGV